MSIDVQNITKTYGGYTALNDVTLSVPSGQLVALLGPSGSGKTTLLRLIAGLEQPDAGSVLFNDRDVAGEHARHRGVGFVFQHYALFKHMTVFDNIAFGLTVRPRRRRPSRGAIAAKVDELLKLIQLEAMSDRYPDQLSGGQRQRVALARALAVEPEVLLLDEPFGALDACVRKELRQWLRRLHDEIHVTSIFVTHDQEEALEVADRIVVMNAGAIEQAGTPDDVFHRPATEFVLDFLGNADVFHGKVDGQRAVFGPLALSGEWSDDLDGSSARLVVRPYDWEILVDATFDETLPVRVARVHSAGPVARLDMDAGGDRLLSVEISHERYRRLGATPGDDVFVRPKESQVFVGGVLYPASIP